MRDEQIRAPRLHRAGRRREVAQSQHRRLLRARRRRRRRRRAAAQGRLERATRARLARSSLLVGWILFAPRVGPARWVVFRARRLSRVGGGVGLVGARRGRPRIVLVGERGAEGEPVEDFRAHHRGLVFALEDREHARDVAPRGAPNEPRAVLEQGDERAPERRLEKVRVELEVRAQRSRKRRARPRRPERRGRVLRRVRLARLLERDAVGQPRDVLDEVPQPRVQRRHLRGLRRRRRDVAEPASFPPRRRRRAAVRAVVVLVLVLVVLLRALPRVSAPSEPLRELGGVREQPRAAALRRAARGRVVPVAAGTDQRRLETRDGVRRDRRHAGAAVAVLVRLVGRVHAREGAERAHRRVRRALRPGEDRHAGAVLRVVALGGIHGDGDSREETRERRRRRRRERLAESRDGADGGARGRLGGGRRVPAAEADRKGPGSPAPNPKNPPAPPAPPAPPPKLPNPSPAS